MEHHDQDVVVAIGLMRMAFTLIEKLGEGAATTLLRKAINATVEEHSVVPGEEIDPRQACLIAGIPLGPS